MGAYFGFSVLQDSKTVIKNCIIKDNVMFNGVLKELMVDTGGNRNMVSIVPHPTAGGPNFTNCVLPGRPVYDAVVFNNFYVNYVDGTDPECNETATAPASWGAIKSLYAD